jgi:membrane-bound ClpP family serine protease
MTMYLTLAFLLIVTGLLLLLVELIFPSGLLATAAVVAILVGIVLTFEQDTTTGVATLLVLGLVLPIAGKLVFHYWPQTRMGRGLFLHAPEEDATLASAPLNQELEQLLGRVGRTASDLRPCGVADFDGRRVDVITEGIMVDAGQWVRCIGVHTGRVLVRPIERPDLNTLVTADFS